MKFYSQPTPQDDGVACLAMILSHYRSLIPLQTLRNRSQTDIDGTSLRGIKHCAESFKLRCQIKQNATSSFFKHSEKLTFPLIATIATVDHLEHYVVISKIKNETITTIDPEKGKVKWHLSKFNQAWTGTVLSFEPSEEYKPIIEKENRLEEFIPLISNNKGIFWTIVISSIFITLIGIVAAYYFQIVIDHLIPKHRINWLIIVSLSIIVMYLFNSIFTFLKSYLLVILGQKMNKSIASSYIRHILHLPMSFFNNRRTGDVISRFQSANDIITGLINLVLSAILDTSMLILVGGTLIFQSPELFIITLLSVPIYLVVVFAYIRSYANYNQQVMQATSDLDAQIIQGVKGIQTLKALNSENFFDNKIMTKFDKLLANNRRLALAKNSQAAINLGLNSIINILILGFGAYLVIKGHLSLGQLMAYNALSSFFTKPLQNIINNQPSLQEAYVANRRLMEFFNVNAEKVSAPSTTPINFSGKIIGESLNFAYGYQPAVLKDVSFKIEAGQKVAFVGPSHAGKSTLLKLLVAFEKSQSGTIVYDDLPLSDIALSDLRQNVVHLAAHPFFFRGTLLENITFGIEPSDDLIKEIKQLAHRLNIASYINNQPHQWQMNIAEDGANLPASIKQRLALLRALLKHSPIMIFDNTFNCLTSTELEEVSKYLLELPNKTMIFATDQDSLINQCDQVFKMQNGKLISD